MTTSAPKTLAKTAGLLYLIPLFCGPFSMMYVPSVVVVPGDATATAGKLVASATLFRMGILSDSAIFVSEVALTAVLYVVLRPAGKALALTATFARLGMAVLQAANLLPAIAALQLVGGAEYLSVFDVGQRRALALFLLDFRVLGTHVWEIFFGLHCLLVGILVWRSGYFPRVLGVLMGLAALGYSLNGLGNLVAPGGARVFGAIVAVGALVGEIPFLLWLLFKGVDAERWQARSAAT